MIETVFLAVAIMAMIALPLYWVMLHIFSGIEMSRIDAEDYPTETTLHANGMSFSLPVKQEDAQWFKDNIRELESVMSREAIFFLKTTRAGYSILDSLRIGHSDMCPIDCNDHARRIRDAKGMITRALLLNRSLGTKEQGNG